MWVFKAVLCTFNLSEDYRVTGFSGNGQAC